MHTCGCLLERKYGMHLRPNTEFPMLVVREFDEVGKLSQEKHYYCSNIREEKRECKPNVSVKSAGEIIL
jgi:hypothetical protein